MTALQTDIEKRLAESEPDVEVLLAELVPGSADQTLRVFIDHPGGVTLGLCERVSAELAPWRERYALEISSPGSERPLTKPDHFRRYIGRRARVRLAGGRRQRSRSRGGTGRDHARDAQPAPEPTRRASYTGELVGASEREITLAADGGIVTIPYAEIRRSNLVEE